MAFKNKLVLVNMNNIQYPQKNTIQLATMTSKIIHNFIKSCSNARFPYFILDPFHFNKSHTFSMTIFSNLFLPKKLMIKKICVFFCLTWASKDQQENMGEIFARCCGVWQKCSLFQQFIHYLVCLQLLHQIQQLQQQFDCCIIPEKCL